MSDEFIIAIDQGTTGSRVFCYDTNGNPISSAYREFTQHFPQPGWVEHDPVEIWNGIEQLLHEALDRKNLNASNAIAIGITNQRETVVVWDRNTGEPVHRAIVWQCRRTSRYCEELKAAGHEPMIHDKTGLYIDAYFSGTKIHWILENVPGARARAENGELIAGTIDAWLLYKLTGVAATDFTNASRTMLFNIRTKEWDPEILRLLAIPSEMLLPVHPSRHRFGTTKNVASLPDGIPVSSLVGDQQGALFGQLCVSPGELKNTYGTGCFLVNNTGNRFIKSRSGLLTTLACDTDGNPVYALEGSIFIAGAAIQWLRDYMKFFADASETEEIIAEIETESDDIVFVPAFAGLGAPHWDMNARGGILGLTRDTSPAHLIRAAVKSIALQSLDVVRAMERDTETAIQELKVDGGASANRFLMNYQAGILDVAVVRPKHLETTALGAAYLAGIEAGVWKNGDALKAIQQEGERFAPSMNESFRENEIRKWHRGVERVKRWIDE